MLHISLLAKVIEFFARVTSLGEGARLGHKLQLDVGLAGALASRIMKESENVQILTLARSRRACEPLSGPSAWSQVSLPNPGHLGSLQLSLLSPI